MRLVDEKRIQDRQRGGNASLLRSGTSQAAEGVRAAPSTVEAVMYELRTYGLAATAGPNCRRRLSELSPDQVRDVIVRLDRLKANYSAITDDLLLALAELIE